MSKLGKRWEISGVPAAFITRSPINGHYCVTFERDEAALEQVERIDWARPDIRKLTDNQEELGLPEGYGFEVEDLSYQYQSRCFVVELRIAQQYLGDVIAYQTRIRELEDTVAQQQTELEQQAVQQKAMIAEMQTAYQEGVESNG